MKRGSLRDLVSDPTNVLVLSPSFTPHDESCCAELVAEGGHDRGALLHVTNTGSPDESIQRWAPHLNASGGELGIIALGEATRSAATSTVQPSGASETSIETIAHPGDLTQLGIEITKRLEAWGRSNDRIVVCFDSLTVLLQYAPLRTVYQFLHVLTSQIKAADGVAHYHLDPTAHDDETVYTLLALFDSVVEIDAEGIRSIRAR